MAATTVQDADIDRAKVLAAEITDVKASTGPSRSAAVADLNKRFAGVDAATFMRAMIEDVFPGRIAVVSSFGAEAAVLLHLVAQIDKTVPVIFLETGMHFPQTLSYRDKITALLGLEDVRSIAPDPADLARDDPHDGLWQSDTDRCCHLRKVQPLDRALREFDVWINGRKQIHGGSRARLPRVEASGRFVKINPMFAATDIYTSIGCWPCTAPASSAELRSGRWTDSAKTECGIHLPSAAE